MKIEYFAEGALDCPLLLIYGDSHSEASLLRQAISDLGEGTKTSLAVHKLPGFEALGECCLLAKVFTEDIGVTETNLAGVFEWTLRTESWAAVAELLEPFTSDIKTGNGFQYLDQTSGIAVLISTSRSW